MEVRVGISDTRRLSAREAMEVRVGISDTWLSAHERLWK